MHCPRCGQQQISDQTKFCSRCGFQLGLVGELLENGGFLPQLAELHKGKTPLFSRKNGVIYIGVTSDLVKRIWQHKNDVVEGFTHRYGVHLLVWYELHPTMESAILREKMLKRWKRDWKMRLIKEGNAGWNDLYPTIL